LDVLDGPPRRGHRSRPLQEIEVKLELSPSQVPPWQAFEETFDEICHAIEASDAIADLQSRDHPPSLLETLETEGRRLAVRLGATRRLAGAATVLLAALTPGQRVRAERYLAAICRRLGGIEPWPDLG